MICLIYQIKYIFALFADDTNIYFESDDLLKVEKIIKKHLPCILYPCVYVINVHITAAIIYVFYR